MKYPLTFYTDKLVPKTAGACVRVILLPVILIRPKYKNDFGLYMHELEHVKQAFKGLLIGHVLLYALSKKYRLKCEVEAYREQSLHYSNDRIPLFANFIANGYNLKVSREEAESMIRGLD